MQRVVNFLQRKEIFVKEMKKCRILNFEIIPHLEWLIEVIIFNIRR